MVTYEHQKKLSTARPKENKNHSLVHHWEKTPLLAF